MVKKILASVLVILLMTASVSLGLDTIELDDKLRDATSLPDFDLKDLTGRNIRSKDLRGQKVVLLAFWSMYCRACVQKFGSLVKLRRKYSPEALEILSINTDGEYQLPEQTIKDFVKGMETRQDFTLEFPVIYDRENFLAGSLGIIFLPAIVSVDKEGKITGTYRRFTEHSDDEIMRGIEEIIPPEGRIKAR